MATVERLRELDHLKSSFLANMSHKLRKPLNSILLVGNATRFTLIGCNTIRAERISGTIRFQIRDPGMGIPPGKLEDIFDTFSQVDTPTTRKGGGTGLGLPFSLRLVELHDERLLAEISGLPGDGSVFFIELPVDVINTSQ